MQSGNGQTDDRSAREIMSGIYARLEYREVGQLYDFLDEQNVIGRRTSQKWWNETDSPNDLQMAALRRADETSKRVARKAARSDDDWRKIAIAAIHELSGNELRETAERLQRVTSVAAAVDEHTDDTIERLMQSHRNTLIERLRESSDTPLRLAASKKSKPHSRKKPPSDQDAD